MSITKFLPVPLMIGVMAAIFMYLANLFSLLSWVSFITWGAYFLSGVNTRGAIREGISVTLGVLFGAVIVMLATAFSGTLGTLSVPIVVGVIAFIIVLLELVPWFDLAPGYFLGAAAFFGAGAKPELSIIIPVLIAALIGLILGVISGYLRGQIFKLEGVADPLKSASK